MTCLESKLIKTIEMDNRATVVENVWAETGQAGEAETDSSQDGVWTSGPRGSILRSLVSAIESAQECVCLSSFLFSESSLGTALISAASRGVRVYTLSSPYRTLDRDTPDQDGEPRERVEEYKQFLDSIAGHILLRAADHFHSKFLLADPRSPSISRGILCTANFNKALTENLEIAVDLTPAELKGVFQQFRVGFWNESSEELLRARQFTPVSPRPTSIRVPHRLDSVLTTVRSERSEIGHNTIRDSLQRFIRESEGPLIASVYSVNSDHDTVKELASCARDRHITLIVRPRLLDTISYRALAEAGAEVLGHDRLHAKAIVSQKNGEPAAIVMTANLESKGLDQGFETGLYLEGVRARRIKSILEGWTKACRWKFNSGVQIGDLRGKVMVQGAKHYEERAVDNETSVDAGVLKQTTLEAEPSPDTKKLSSYLAHRVILSYTIERPRLPRGATQIEDPESPLPVYRRGGNMFIAVLKLSDLEPAVRLKEGKYKSAAIVMK